MMTPFLTIPLVLLLCATFVKSASAQIIANVVGAPLTATVTLHNAREGEAPSQTTRRIARASDGSTYSASYGPDGTLGRVEIDDVPTNRRITFFVPPPNDFSHTYMLRTPPHGKFRLWSTEEIRQQVRCQQDAWTEEPDRQKENGRVHDIVLGERSSDGMTLFGFRSEKTYDDGSKKMSEHWWSDLGIMISDTNVGPGEGRESSYVVTNLKREEPDPSLFQIPNEYLFDPLLDANTIFLDNQTGSQPVLDGAVSELNEWKRRSSLVKALVIVKEKSAADLTAVFTQVPVTDQGSTASGLKLLVFLRNASQPVFERTVGIPDTPHGEKWAGGFCLVQFWNRLSSTKVGQVSTSSQSKAAAVSQIR